MQLRFIQIILFVVITVPAFSQGYTFKKKKKQLLYEQETLISELNDQRKSYFSLKDSCNALLNQGYELVVQGYEFYGRLRLLNHRIHQSSEQLSLLGLFNYRDRIKTDTISLEKESEIESAFLKEKKAYKEFDYRMKDIVLPNLTDLPRKQQLAVLVEWNSSAKIQLEKESTFIKNTMTVIERVHTIIAEMKNQLELFPSREKCYLEVSDLIVEQLNAARANYAKNGPKGFDYNYEIIFPEVSFSTTSLSEAELFETASASAQYSEDQEIEFTSSRKNAIEGDIYEFVDEPPAFPGNVKFYIKEHLVYPEFALEYGLEGKCYLKFIVSSIGEISNVRVMRGVPDCNECDTEAKRLVENMPNWNPGKVGGKPVDCYFNLPVNFKIE